MSAFHTKINCKKFISTEVHNRASSPARNQRRQKTFIMWRQKKSEVNTASTEWKKQCSLEETQRHTNGGRCLHPPCCPNETSYKHHQLPTWTWRANQIQPMKMKWVWEVCREGKITESKSEESRAVLGSKGEAELSNSQLKSDSWIVDSWINADFQKGRQLQRCDYRNLLKE